jgi:two-component sensor histidine kinase
VPRAPYPPDTPEAEIPSPDLLERLCVLEAENADLRASSAGQGFGDLARHMPQIVWTASATGAITYVNRPWLRPDPGSPRTGSGLVDAVHPDDMDKARATWASAVRWGEAFEGEVRLREGPGSRYRWHLWNATPVRHGPGGPVRSWVGTATDIDDRHRAEARLRENETRLGLASEAAGFGTWDLNLATREVRWSASNFAVWGVPAPSPLGGFLSAEETYALISPEDRDRVRNEIEEARVGDGIFRSEFRVAGEDGEVRWVAAMGRRSATRSSGDRIAGVNIDVTDRRRSDERRDLMNNELNHRVKNTLAVVQSMATQSFRGIGASDPQTKCAVATARASFEGRLFTLARAHDVLTRESWESAPIRDVVRDATAHLRPCEADAFSIHGPNLRLPPAMAVGLALTLHELCTNAVKYGALSVPEGRVELAWTRAVSEGVVRLRLRWTERGGPRIGRQPTRRGFGSRLIERSMADDGDGQVRLDFAPDGLECTLDVALPGSAPAIPATGMAG